MWLRLDDQIRRLLRRPAHAADAGRPGTGGSRSGGHRKRGRFAWSSRSEADLGRQFALQPPAGIQSSAGVQSSADAPDPGAAYPGAARSAAGGGAGRARIREAPFGAAPVETALAKTAAPGPAAARSARHEAPRQPWYQVIGPSAPANPPASPGPAALAKAALAKGRDATAEPAGPARDPRQPRLPFTPPLPRGLPAPPEADGRVHCGPLERILWRQWEEGATPHPRAAAAVERLASFPRSLQERLADGLAGIYVGEGGVPELDDMSGLRGVPLPSGRATWDACAGAYGERKIVIGTRPSPTPDVMCHEIGHALDDLDSPPGRWQSDSAEFMQIYDQCERYLESDFHRQRGGLGRKEFFADAFAAIASRQRPALVDMLRGNTRLALRVMLYFNRRYGI